MTPAARLAAAIEVLDAIAARRTPADVELKAWAKTRRFAGSGDRRAIAERVYAVLRARARLTWRMGADDGRALVLGSLLELDGLSPPEIEGLFNGEGHAPAPLTEAERERFEAALETPSDEIAAGVPAFVAEALATQFGSDAAAEAQALIGDRAPVDLRVNTLRGDVDAALRLLAVDAIEPDRCPLSTLGLRLPPARYADVQTTRAHQTGWVEVQDEASQLAAALSGAAPGMTVIDWCAGGGGKTLALAAMMRTPFPLQGGRAGEGGSDSISPAEVSGGVSADQHQPSGARTPSPLEGEGRLLALDIDAKRLAALAPRLDRAGAFANIRQLRRDYLDTGVPAEVPPADLVFVDAPCSGSGTWRRHPEAAWRLTPEAVTRLAALQLRILTAAANRVKRGGRLAYATCSVLHEENGAVAEAFLARHPDFAPRSIADALDTPLLTPAARDRLSALADPPHMLQMTPRRTGTDGFFIALFERTP